MGGLQQAQQQLQQASMRLASVQAHLQASTDSQRRARQQRDALALRLAQLDDELAVEVDAGEQDEGCNCCWKNGCRWNRRWPRREPGCRRW